MFATVEQKERKATARKLRNKLVRLGQSPEFQSSTCARFIDAVVAEIERLETQNGLK